MMKDARVARVLSRVLQNFVKMKKSRLRENVVFCMEAVMSRVQMSRKIAYKGLFSIP